jgi:Skp family chaperone for outer membrane proteins
MKLFARIFSPHVAVGVFSIFFLPPLQMASASVGFVNTERVLNGSKAGNDIGSANRAIKAIAEAELIYFVFQEAVYASPRIDITERVLSRLKGSSVRPSAFPESVQMAFVNTEQVLRESGAARAAQKRLEEEFAERERKLQEIEKQLRASTESLTRESPVISESSKSSRSREIASLERDLQRRQSEFRESLNQRRNEELAKVVEHANRAIRQIAEASSIDIIFQESVYASPASDITAAVISKMEDMSSRMVAKGVTFDPQTVRFLNSERILRDSKPAKSAQQKLEAEFKSRERALSSGQHAQTLNEDQKRFREDLNARRNQELALVVESANKEIRAIAERNSINFVFQKAVYASPNVDMSAQVISALDKTSDNVADSSSGTEPKRTTSAPMQPGQLSQQTSAVVLSVSTSPPDPSGVVTLTIAANSDTASLKINGDEEGGRADGRYSVRRFAQVGENRFEVVATDRFGNTQRQTVSVVRQAADTSVRFAALNPTNVRARPATDAVAIIIGIQDYRRVPKAEFANNDARLFYDYAIRGLGVRPENIKLLLDQQADDIEILAALQNWLPLKSKKGQTDVYVFYSGHGLPSDDGSTLYLLPHGVDRQFLDRTAIKQAELVSALQAVKPKSVTLFLDACYSGQIRTGETLLASARPIAIQPKATSFPANFTVISASAPDQIASSSPELKHGVFSYFLMKGMEGDADLNKDGRITVSEMQSYLSDSVGRKAMSLSRTQQPQLVGDQNKVLVSR